MNFDYLENVAFSATVCDATGVHDQLPWPAHRTIG